MKKPLEVGKKCWVVTFNEIKEGIVTDILPEKIHMDFPPIKDINQVGLFRPEIVFATPTEAAEYMISKCKPKDEVKRNLSTYKQEPEPYKLHDRVYFVYSGILAEGEIATILPHGFMHMVRNEPNLGTGIAVSTSRVSRTYTEATSILNRMTKITNSLGQTLWLLPGDRVWVRDGSRVVECTFDGPSCSGTAAKITPLDFFTPGSGTGIQNIYLTKQDAQRAILAEKVTPKEPEPTKVSMYINGVLVREMEAKTAGSMGDVYSNVPKSYEGEKNVPTPADQRIDALEKLVLDNQKYVFRHVDAQSNLNHDFKNKLADNITSIQAHDYMIEALQEKVAALENNALVDDACNDTIVKRLDALEKRVELAISEGNIEGDAFEKRLADFDKRQTVLGEAFDSFVKHFSSVLSRLDALENPKSVKKP